MRYRVAHRSAAARPGLTQVLGALVKNRWSTYIVQIVPPLLLLWPASTRHGPALVIFAALLIWVGAFCVIRILLLFAQMNRPRIRFLRPTLTLLVCVLTFMHMHISLRPARAFAEKTASEIQAQCKAHRQCPRVIDGWEPRHDRYSSQVMVGQWVRWPVMYHSDGNKFDIWLYILLDTGEAWSGSVSRTRT